MPRRGRGKKRKGGKKEEKKGLRYLFRLSIEGLYPGRRRGFAGLSRALIKRERGGKEGEKRGKRGRKGEEKRVLILKIFRGLRPRTPLNWGGSAPPNPPALEGASPPLGVYSRQGSASRSRYALPWSPGHANDLPEVGVKSFKERVRVCQCHWQCQCVPLAVPHTHCQCPG